jgi:hypothetical protein
MMSKQQISAGAFLALLLCASLPAQVQIGPDGPVAPRNVPRQAQGPRELFLVVDPAAEPMPALRYSFATEVLQRKAGNAAPFYYRSFWLMAQVDDAKRAEVMEYLDASLVDIREHDVGQLLTEFDDVFDEIRTATVREHCDWQWRMKDLDGMKAIEFLLPEASQLRDLGRLLAIRARWEIANGRYEEAVETLRQGYQLARDTGRPRSLVSSLVGIAIASVMNEQLIELIQSRNSPNLYWAIAELPRPLIEIRKAIELELSWPDRIFPFLRDAETVERSPDEWKRLFRQTIVKIGQLSAVTDMPFGNDLAMTGIMMHGYVRAKRRLAEQGFDEAELNQMPAMQVIAIYQSRVNRRIRDEIRKWSLLPHDQAWARLEQSEAMLQTDGYFGIHSENGEVLPMASLLFPALSAARKAEARSWTSLNFLQTIEALRMYAADHDGQLPDSLDDIRSVPVPRDPVTMGSFAYERRGTEAILEIPAVPGRAAVARWRVTIGIRQ